MENCDQDLNTFLNLGEKGADCIVFQYGSHSVKFGYASQYTPFVIQNCIAYRKFENNEMNVDEERATFEGDNNEAFLNNLINMEQDVLKRLSKLEQKVKKNKSLTKPYSNTIKVILILTISHMIQVTARLMLLKGRTLNRIRIPLLALRKCTQCQQILMRISLIIIINGYP
jgi:hypothetical protein